MYQNFHATIHHDDFFFEIFKCMALHLFGVLDTLMIEADLQLNIVSSSKATLNYRYNKINGLEFNLPFVGNEIEEGYINFLRPHVPLSS